MLNILSVDGLFCLNQFILTKIGIKVYFNSSLYTEEVPGKILVTLTKHCT